MPNARGEMPVNTLATKRGKGLVADFSVRRLTLWSRSQAIETRRVPAPSHLAQRDVAKTSVPLADRNPRGVLQANQRQRLLAQSQIISRKLPGGRAPITQGGPNWRKPNCQSTAQILYLIAGKIPKILKWLWKLKLFSFIHLLRPTNQHYALV